ncbi:MAG TPA: adenylyl-sulfate kinase [Arenimonas sp.]|uniref:adenylyl-sulfate kinase n=1 Tax=Arenimonas sp. TaxID=1872635 RepID=UPI002CF48C5C|nr:adenylyl-sulfate kinase [Arenimonas sp.]HMB56246.1 adenylyl-sulfate kinase [Arenimonas sp.]
MTAATDTIPRLRFITCGSVDDGKSTLIGRLLYETGALFDDQLTALAADSRRHGTQGANIDYALLLDGLAAEREQGITIDVAYRYFHTARRSFIVADCPGHEQYTRNMATGASTADLAVVLVDARKGLLPQTRRHSYLVHLFGIRQIVLAVNKMDQVGYSQEVFDRIVAEYQQLATTLGIDHITALPVSGLVGDNVIAASANTPWYGGPSLLAHLESVDLDAPRRSGFSRDPAYAKQEDEGARSRLKPLLQDTPFRLPVQWVCRPDQDFRGFTGQVAAGTVAVGDAVVVLPAGKTANVTRLQVGEQIIERAQAGQSILLCLDAEIDVSRGDVIAAVADPPAVADQFAVHLLWLHDAPLLPGRRYALKLGARTVNAQVTEIKHKIDVNTQEHLAATRLELNEIAYCNLSLDQAIAFESFADNRTLGSFILIDKQTLATVAGGTIDFALRRSANVHWQALAVDQAARAKIKQQTPRCLWFTGLSGSGKSTIANLVEKRLLAAGQHTYLLDGDNLRHGLNRDLGFRDEDRVENIRRVAEVARLMVDAGLIVIVSFISPFKDERRMARNLFKEGEFIEVFVDTPLADCERRDVKGLYAKARAGQIPNFTGIDSPYEPPEHAELVLDTLQHTPQQLAEIVAQKAL